MIEPRYIKMPKIKNVPKLIITINIRPSTGPIVLKKSELMASKTPNATIIQPKRPNKAIFFWLESGLSQR